MGNKTSSSEDTMISLPPNHPAYLSDEQCEKYPDIAASQLTYYPNSSSKDRALAALFLLATQEYKQENDQRQKETGEELFDEEINHCNEILGAVGSASFSVSDALHEFHDKQVASMENIDYDNGVFIHPFGFVPHDSTILTTCQIVGDMRFIIKTIQEGDGPRLSPNSNPYGYTMITELETLLDIAFRFRQLHLFATLIKLGLKNVFLKRFNDRVKMPNHNMSSFSDFMRSELRQVEYVSLATWWYNHMTDKYFYPKDNGDFLVSANWFRLFYAVGTALSLSKQPLSENYSTQPGESFSRLMNSLQKDGKLAKLVKTTLGFQEDKTFSFPTDTYLDPCIRLLKLECDSIKKNRFFFYLSQENLESEIEKLKEHQQRYGYYYDRTTVAVASTQSSLRIDAAKLELMRVFRRLLLAQGSYFLNLSDPRLVTEILKTLPLTITSTATDQQDGQQGSISIRFEKSQVASLLLTGLEHRGHLNSNLSALATAARLSDVGQLHQHQNTIPFDLRTTFSLIDCDRETWESSSKCGLGLISIIDCFSQSDDDGFSKRQAPLPENFMTEQSYVQFANQHRHYPGQPCFVTAELFEKKWKKYSQNVLEGFESDFGWVIGGSVVACLDTSTDEFNLSSSTNRDLDLVFAGLSDIGVGLEFLRFDTFMRNKYGNTMITIARESFVGYILPYPLPRVKLLKGSWSSIQHVLELCDVDCTGVGFSLASRNKDDDRFLDDVDHEDHEIKPPLRVVCTVRALHSWMYRLNFPSQHSFNIRGTPHYETRLYKYAVRYGFAIAHFNVKPNDETVRKLSDPQVLAKISPLDRATGICRTYVIETGKIPPPVFDEDSSTFPLNVFKTRTPHDVEKDIKKNHWYRPHEHRPYPGQLSVPIREKGWMIVEHLDFIPEAEISPRFFQKDLLEPHYQDLLHLTYWVNPSLERRQNRVSVGENEFDALKFVTRVMTLELTPQEKAELPQSLQDNWDRFEPLISNIDGRNVQDGYFQGLQEISSWTTVPCVPDARDIE
jgi:hypothetical protein